MAMKDLKIIVSGNHDGLILIYYPEFEKYHLWYNNKIITRDIKGKKPDKRITEALSKPKPIVLKNLDNFRNDIKQLYDAIYNELGIDEKPNEFVLKDLMVELTGNEKTQRNNFDALSYHIKTQYFRPEQLTSFRNMSLHNHVNKSIFISRKVENHYLCYIGSLSKYILFNCSDSKKEEYDIGTNPNKLANLIEETIIEHGSHYQMYNLGNEGLIEILNTLENNKILFKELFDDLNDAYYFSNDEGDDSKKIERIDAIDNDLFVRNTLLAETDNIDESDNEIKNAIAYGLIENIKDKLEDRENKEVEKARRDLSDLLDIYYGIALRKYMGTIYRRVGNGYEPTSHDDLIVELTTLFDKNFIHDADLKKAIGYISKRLEPVPNIVKFKNVLYDMNKLETFNPSKPIFTVLNIPYKYNPNAKSTMFKKFLNTSFKRESEEETVDAVKGIKQLCGYFFTSGNSMEILPVFTGLTGAGKSTLLNILTGIFGKDKISGISLQSLENDIHASSGFIGKHLNIIRDSDVSMIKNNAILKSWTGNEAYPVNPKFKDLFDLPATEVPKPILACNTMPVFKVYDDAVIRRFVIVEFLVSMTKKGEAIKDLDKKILENNEEVEWFIYESLEAYKDMIRNNETFIFKISDEETKELIEKHTHPLNHIIQMLIRKHDPKAYDDDRFDNNFRPVFTDDLVNAIMYVSDDKGIDVPVNKHGKIDKRNLLNVIRDEFDLHDGEIVKNKNTGRYENHRDYTARSERYNGLNKKAYPNLIATPEYIEILKRIKKEKKEK